MGAMRRMWALVARSKMDREIDDELRSHMAMRTEDNISAGMSGEEAARDARLRFGNPAVMKERVTERDAALGVDAILRDMRYALRGFVKNPGFAIVAVITLALGIGANTAIFQLLDAVRLRSLPIQNPQELAEIRIAGGNQGFGVTNSQYAELTRPIWQQIRRQHEPFSGVFVWRKNERLLGEMSESHRVHVLEVSGEFFSVLGIHPAQGRLLLPDDEASACTAPRVVVSYPFWQSQMGGQALTAATSLKIDNELAEVVGVAPPSFFGMAVGENFDIATPLIARRCNGQEWRREVFDVAVMGRLKPGWTIERASSYFGSLSPGILDATAPTDYSANAIKKYKAFKLAVYPAGAGVSGLRQAYDSSLWLLLAITGLVLLIACTNLANLMMARASTRQREMAVRMALGASRARLLRQMLMESGMLAATGAVLAVGVAQLFSRILIWSLSTHDGAIDLVIRTDWRVLLFAAAVATLTCAIFGTLPALRASKSDPATALKAGDKRMAGSHERFPVQRAMVTTQIAVSLVLLVGALLFVRSFHNLMTLNAGMRTSGITIGRFGFPMAHVAPEQFEESKRQMLEEVRTVPGVRNAALTTMAPLSGGSWTHVVRVGSSEGESKFTWVSPGYFETMQIPLIGGRSFNQNDTAASPRVVIVNQTFVKTYLGGVNPIGQVVRSLTEPDYPGTAFEVVGVIADTKYNDVKTGTPPMAFVPALQFPVSADGPWAQMVIESNSPDSTIAAIRHSIGEKHPQTIMQFSDLETGIHEGFLRERLMAILAGFFGALAAALVIVGLYGVISYFVTLRQNEIGIRIALGATRWQVVALVMRDAAWMLLLGLTLGTVLALFAGRGATSILFGLKPYDPVTLLFAIGLLTAIAALASWIPARRASKLDPMEALRCE